MLPVIMKASFVTAALFFASCYKNSQVVAGIFDHAQAYTIAHHNPESVLERLGYFPVILERQINDIQINAVNFPLYRQSNKVTHYLHLAQKYMYQFTHREDIPVLHRYGRLKLKMVTGETRVLFLSPVFHRFKYDDVKLTEFTHIFHEGKLPSLDRIVYNLHSDVHGQHYLEPTEVIRPTQLGSDRITLEFQVVQNFPENLSRQYTVPVDWSRNELPSIEENILGPESFPRQPRGHPYTIYTNSEIVNQASRERKIGESSQTAHENRLDDASTSPQPSTPVARPQHFPVGYVRQYNPSSPNPYGNAQHGVALQQLDSHLDIALDEANYDRFSYSERMPP